MKFDQKARKAVDLESVEADMEGKPEQEEVIDDMTALKGHEGDAASEDEGLEDLEDLEDLNSNEADLEELVIDEEEDSLEKKKNKSFFKKKEKKDKKDEKVDELNDRLIRLMAEFDNYRKRTEKEKSQMFEIGAKDIVEKILPVVDNFERGLGLVAESEKESAFIQGFDRVYKQLVDSLESAGVKVIEAVGKEFDPNLHNAVMHSEDEEQGENIVAEEFQKGYMYKDSVVRHSMVRVVN